LSPLSISPSLIHHPSICRVAVNLFNIHNTFLGMY
jgi:hypothetical protein